MFFIYPIPSVFGRLSSVFGRLQNPFLLVLSSKTDRFRRPFKPSTFWVGRLHKLCKNSRSDVSSKGAFFRWFSENLLNSENRRLWKKQISCPKEIGLLKMVNFGGNYFKTRLVSWVLTWAEFCFSFAVLCIWKRINAKSAKPTSSGSRGLWRPSKPTVFRRWHEKSTRTMCAEKGRRLPKFKRWPKWQLGLTASFLSWSQRNLPKTEGQKWKASPAKSSGFRI